MIIFYDEPRLIMPSDVNVGHVIRSVRGSLDSSLEVAGVGGDCDTYGYVIGTKVEGDFTGQSVIDVAYCTRGINYFRDAKTRPICRFVVEKGPALVIGEVDRNSGLFTDATRLCFPKKSVLVKGDSRRELADLIAEYHRKHKDAEPVFKVVEAGNYTLAQISEMASFPAK